MTRVRVIGAGPAGSAAAISALQSGAAVDLYEKSTFPRHKVCGEFLSPDVVRLLDRLGLDWKAAHPAKLTRLMLCFGARESMAPLPETAFGLSRFGLDQMLLDRSLSLGAQFHREVGVPAPGPTVIATGRKSAAPKGNRLFGFKAHFSGPSSDVMALYFYKDGAYVGVNAIEGGATNVCGVAPEQALAAVGFDIDAYLNGLPALRNRLQGMTRQWKWIRVGPLVFENRLQYSTELTRYYAGDSLSFVDPFTGSGILSALLTGTLAGRAAALGECSENYSSSCKQLLRQPFWISTLFRLSIRTGVAQYAERILPHAWLFRLTRPKLLPDG